MKMFISIHSHFHIKLVILIGKSNYLVFICILLVDKKPERNLPALGFLNYGRKKDNGGECSHGRERVNEILLIPLLPCNSQNKGDTVSMSPISVGGDWLQDTEVNSKT
jgi:hypothetical protein